MGIDAEIYAVVPKGTKYTAKEILELSYEVGCTFGSDKFFRSRDKAGHHNISACKKIEQDGPDYEPENGEQILRVHVWTRYYGPGYERGDLPFLIMLAEWLERRVPGAQILYGGDSSGVLAEPWGPKERKKYLDHFCSPKGRDYYRRADSLFGKANEIPVCPLCKQPMDNCGGGRGHGFYACGGCGQHAVTHKDGVLFMEEQDHDFFKASQKLESEGK